MRSYARRVLAVTAVAAVMAVTAGVAPGHAASLGTYTRITTPSGTKYFTLKANAINHFTVSGRASKDVTKVDVDCVFRSSSTVVSTTLASNVPVSGGAFSGIATVPSLLPPCQLLAIPSTDEPESTYLASFTGPVVYTEAASVEKSGAVVDGAAAADGQGSGFALAGDDSSCEGVQFLTTIRPPTMTVEGTADEICLTTLAPTNLTEQGSATQVNGQNAYLPWDVAHYLINDQSLAVTQSASTVSSHLAANHDITLTETAPLMKCSGSNLYPPTTASCPSLVKTGVSVTRVIEFIRGAHQVVFRYRFTSTDGHAHSVNADILTETVAPDTGAVGYAFPGHGSAPKPVSGGQKITGLGSKAGSVVVRGDVDASGVDPTTQTYALTWSRAPSSVQFGEGSTTFFGFQYALSVPAHGSADMGLADSEATTTTAALSLAKAAVADLVAAPTVAKPGRTVHGTKTTVAGTVAAGANGLVRVVTVNGHKATLRAVGTSSDKFTVTFNESVGTHKLTIVATDTAGNTSSKTITVKNTA